MTISLTDPFTDACTEAARGRRQPQGGAPVRGLIGALLILSWQGFCLPSGYEAMGYFTYTGFSASGSPFYRTVQMFDVKVHSGDWHIRTEPVIEGEGGIGFNEASLVGTNSVLVITALPSAYKSSESPFSGLHDLLKESRKADPHFDSRLSQSGLAAAHAWLEGGMNPRRRLAGQSKRAISNQIDNVAVAFTLRGRYPPPTDPSYEGLLLFAFTPPEAQRDVANKLLVQIWDDGEHHRTRFRRAAWQQFADPPYLVSSADYTWIGKELLPDGTLEDLNVSHVSAPHGVAARYEVGATTNLDGLVLPRDFRVTRFDTRRRGAEDPRVVSTFVASTFKVKPLSPEGSLEARLPGCTVVADYRASMGPLKESPVVYVLNSNSLPSVEQVKAGSRYKALLRSAPATQQWPRSRWVVLGLLLVSPLIFWMISKRTQTK